MLYSWVNQRFRLGHFPVRYVKLPEGRLSTQDVVLKQPQPSTLGHPDFASVLEWCTDPWRNFEKSDLFRMFQENGGLMVPKQEKVVDCHFETI